MQLDNMALSILIVGLGLILTALGLASYSIRTFFNKKNWRNPTKALTISGIVVLLIGIVSTYVNYAI